eukprot:CAMPEP_0172299250 /NCGR_PEP_ID=MMETSP1058-20130122/1613_1 /TAXON_ID=83371 /ORGANISM="Detonula confervacea, Strain CCMP 353" /LENGTH=33 /DNA_ID= /DNA_START= /DNA_END= /DNA_ORIENTATION=
MYRDLFYAHLLDEDGCGFGSGGDLIWQRLVARG